MLVKNILLRSIEVSMAIMVLYIVYGFFVTDYTTVGFSGLVLIIFIACYAFTAYGQALNYGKRAVIIIYMLFIIYGFFNQGGLLGITALNLCGLIILISTIFTGIEMRAFIFGYVSMITFFIWVHLFQNTWVIDYRQFHSEGFLITERLIYIFYILYIGYFCKSEYEKKRLKITEINQKLEEAYGAISTQNKDIIAYNCQLKALVAELQAEQDKVVDMNRRLKKANVKIARQNEYIVAVNTQLEDIVAERTRNIKDLNRKIVCFAQYNAHRIRGPLARIIGLVQIMEIDVDNDQSPFNYETYEFYIENLRRNAFELDEMVRGVSILLSENDINWQGPDTL